MYSIVLFIVQNSLSWFFGSGEIPTSAVDRMAATVSSGTLPVNSTNSASPSRSRMSTSSSKQSPDPMRTKPMSRRPSWFTMTSATSRTMSTPSWGPITPM